MFSKPALLVAGFASIYSAASLLHMPSSPLRDSAPVLFHAYLLFLASSIFHEFGHAAAAQRFGAKPREIGIAIYLVYLAFYSDVTSTWGLAPKKRAVVDLAGAYFQIAVGDVFLLCYKLTGNRSYLIAVGLILLSIVMCLNPIFKFDGYWTLADLLDLGRLDMVPQKLAAHLWHTIRRSPKPPLPWRGLTFGILVAYSVAYVVVWGAFAIRLLPMSIALLMRTIASTRGLAVSFRFAAISNWLALFSLLCTLVFLLSCVRIAYQLGLLAVRKVRLALERRGASSHPEFPSIALAESGCQTEAAPYGATAHK